ncbi:MAG TPA: hypothetical protein VHF25_11205, partial [Nitriliruptorales bacterium]|nr:hypothetical protein [Nitriliruptorales bacterium]
MGILQTSTLAAGPLAGLLAHGRTRLGDQLGEGTLVAGSGVRPYLLALIAERHAPLIVVSARSSDADALVDGLAAFLGADRVALFPPWETLPHERLSPQPATVGQRLAVLDRLRRSAVHPDGGSPVPDSDGGEPPLAAVVVPVRAALQPMDPKLGERAPLTIDRRYDGGFDRLLDQLVQLGYDRVTQVETRGQFAVRGGILDVFPTAGAHAVRLEFWGDDVESMREFAVADQRSTNPVDRVRVDPARELVIDADLRARARAVAARLPSIADQLHLLADGVMFEGIESLVTLLHPRPRLLPEFLPSSGGLALVDPLLVLERAATLRREAEALLEVAWETAAGHRPEDAGYADVDLLLDRTPGPTWQLTPFVTERGAVAPLDSAPWESFQGDTAALARRLGAMDQRVV